MAETILGARGWECGNSMLNAADYGGAVSVSSTDKHTGTIKKFATAHGKASKQDMIDAAIKKFPGQTVIDDNQADALHLLSLVVFDMTGEDICNAGM